MLQPRNVTLFGGFVLRLTTCSFAALAVAGSALAEDALPPIGQPVAAFTVKDIRYLPRSLDDLDRPKFWVIAFTTTQCPIAKRYLPRLQELSNRFGEKGVQFLAVDAGADDSIQDVALQAMEFRIAFPFVKDVAGAAVKACGVTRTPEVVILDAERRLRYRGRIDDQYRLGGVQEKPFHPDLAAAIDDLLAGREIAIKETPVDGCAISAAIATKGAATEDKAAPTFSRDVAPIIFNHCAGCHHPGTEAPFSLLSYRNVVAQSETIAEVVADGRMPPWSAHPSFGKFVNDRRLSAEERETIVRWVHSGAAEGDAGAAPAPPKFPEGKWAIGEPDKVITALLPEKVPADGVIPYRYVVLPYLFPFDTWVQGIEILPDNLRVVHHANLGFVKLGERFDANRNFLTGRVPGGGPMELRDGTAILIPKGSVIGLEVHYVTTGKEETDRLSVGLRYAKEPIQKRVSYLHMTRSRFAIPPNVSAYELAAKQTLACDATGIGLFTHMHLRGKDTTFTALHPDGARETLLIVPNFSFDWQMNYQYGPGTMHLKKGTTIEAVSHYDNSKFNPFNPDPNVTVRFGRQTSDEMMDTFFFYTDDSEHLNLQVDPKTGRALQPGEEAKK